MAATALTFPATPRPATRCARSVRRPSIHSPSRWPSASRAPIPARHADHRIDRNGRGHETVLRRRRRALPRRRECLAPDEGLGGQTVPANGVTAITEIQVGIDGITSRPPRTARSETSRSATSTWRSPRRPSASRTAPRPGRTSTASLPAIPIRVYGPPPTSGTRDALGELS